MTRLILSRIPTFMLLLPLLLASQAIAQEGWVVPSGEDPIVIQQDAFGNIYAQQPGEAGWVFSPTGPGSYTYTQGLDRWGSISTTPGGGTTQFDNRLDGSYRYSWTPFFPIPGAPQNGIVIENQPRGRR